MWRRVYCWVKKISKQAQPFRLRSTSVLKIFLNLLKNYILVNYSNISSSFNRNLKKSWLVEPVRPASWMSSDPFYSTLPNLYKSKPIWPHFMQLFGPNFGPRKTLELASKHLLVWFINVGSFKVSSICRCWTTSNCLQSNNPTARNQYVHLGNKLSAICSETWNFVCWLIKVLK